MIKLLIEEADRESIIQDINDINSSDKPSQLKISKIESILNSLDVGYAVDLAKDVRSGSTSIIKRDRNMWEGFPYTYSTYDIADEIVNGKHRLVTDVWDTRKAKPVLKQTRDLQIFKNRYGL